MKKVLIDMGLWFVFISALFILFVVGLALIRQAWNLSNWISRK